VTAAALLVGGGLQTAAAQTAPASPPASVRPFHGNISPFHGNISPFYGNISPFHGNISPFWGNIQPFWGNISPFHGNISPFWGNIQPFHGNISPFWGNIQPFWGNISPFVSDLQTNWGRLPQTGAAGQSAVRDQLQQLISRSENFWGAAVRAQTGRSFNDTFVANILRKYGIDLNRPETLANVSAENRARFMFDWYDGLMMYSGRDIPDHWMATARWNPAITQQQGAGTGVTIGLVDMAIMDQSLTGNVTRWAGNSAAMNGHGGAVASLLVAAHDGRGVMGIAPNASIALFNPFDATGTTNWSEVARGVVSVTNAGASVVNLSLGVPGFVLHQDFRMVYTNATVAPVLDRTIFVQAAGNDGVTQTQNVTWDFNNYPHLLLVGSVGPSGEISTFSNRPGDACLVRNRNCVERLRDRFLVAPGEWILVSDGAGGVTRQSGTSFAAPMVTGAIALMHDRWPWLRAKPEATIEILLQSARDLGAPGVDGVYGHGLLDIKASQSPLAFDDLYMLAPHTNGKLRRVYMDDVRDVYEDSDTAARQRLWNSVNGFLTTYEDTDDTFRDFLIPVTTTLTTASSNGRTEALQYFLQASFLDWMKSGFAQEVESYTPGGGMLRFGFSPRTDEVRDGELAYNFGLVASNEAGAKLRIGRGDGAVALHNGGPIDAASAKLATGGVDPVFGLASGGLYLGAAHDMPAGFSVALAATTRQSEAFVTAPTSGEQTALNPNVAPYEAQAMKAELRQAVSPEIAWSMAYSFLNERAAVLGVQSSVPEAFADGAQTDALTVGAEWTPSPRVAVALSATMGKTRPQSPGAQTLAVGAEGLATSAFEAAVTVNGVAGKTDRMRLRVAQPMQLEAGHFDMTSVEVIDRMSGELGVVTKRVDLDGGDRAVLLEGMYAAPFLNGMGEFAAFARVDVANGFDADAAESVAGASLKLRF
jgi:hypothetical protein